MRKHGGSDSVGRVIRMSKGNGLTKGSTQRVQRYGGETKGTPGTGDPKAPTFVKQNNVDPRPKNI